MAGWISRFVRTSSFWTFASLATLAGNENGVNDAVVCACYLLLVQAWHYSRFDSSFAQSVDTLCELGVWKNLTRKLSLNLEALVHRLNHVATLEILDNSFTLFVRSVLLQSYTYIELIGVIIRCSLNITNILSHLYVKERFYLLFDEKWLTKRLKYRNRKIFVYMCV